VRLLPACHRADRVRSRAWVLAFGAGIGTKNIAVPRTYTSDRPSTPTNFKRVQSATGRSIAAARPVAGGEW
jgi:hypothetical protein